MHWPRRSIRGEWRDYCIYSGSFLPAEAMNDEHVVPKALGGFRSTVIRSSRKLNSTYASTIDAPVANDPMIMFGRRDAGARGHSRKNPVPIIRGARSWKPGQSFDEGEARYSVEVSGSGPARVWDTRTRTYLPEGVFIDTGFYVRDWKIDHTARFKFVVKTLLGVGWKFFGTDLLDAVDHELLRSMLNADLELGEGSKGGALSYTDTFLAKSGTQEGQALNAIKAELVRDKITTILMREMEGTLEWSVSCVGHLVGCVRTSLKASLLGGDVLPYGGIRLEITKEGLRPVLVSPFRPLG